VALKLDGRKLTVNFRLELNIELDRR
jgi:hypothetical protein